MSCEQDLMSTTCIPPDLILAYRQTDFHVYGDQPTVLRVDMVNDVLVAVHRSNGVSGSAFITACNPHSRALSEQENVQRQSALAQELQERGVHFVEGCGQHASNKWPGEPSYLVMGLSLADAKALGHRLEQNAILWSGADAVPKLVLLR
ncbi:DUF3293 domain-containing protein [Paucibacter sp. DJ1R-11]|uniref:DUF3293 domain-containing protein n=1 Tax=Paucibacter sp. DJ1R-11 TaxID=2893556 RepID=UPI0021E3AD87|nr:DUF3293 domain-containing protein [Paucibacter sp. DJ1R-11]MCV2365844.1 DUF3293 domain-containing protein [Paucibacter sp. DJ1R-11]